MKQRLEGKRTSLASEAQEKHEKIKTTETNMTASVKLNEEDKKLFLEMN